MSKPADWAIDIVDDSKVSPALTTETETAERADTFLFGELELTVMLITYLVRVGQHREAAGLLNDSDKQRLRDVECCAQEMMEVLDGLIKLGAHEVVIDGGEQ